MPCRRPRSTRASRMPTATWSPTRRTIPKDFVDPPVLIFAYTPVEDPAVYAKVWDGFLKHLEKVTGKRVQFFPVQSNAAQIEAMRAGRLHVAGFNTGSNPLAVNCAGFVPFALMASTRTAVTATRWRSSPIPGSRHRQDRGHQGQEDGLHRRRPRTPATRRRRPCCATSSSWRPARTTSRCSPASTTIRSSASPTRTIRPPRSPTQCMQRMIERGVVKKEQIDDDLQVEDLPDHRLRHGLQSEAGAGRPRSRRRSSPSRGKAPSC